MKDGEGIIEAKLVKMLQVDGTRDAKLGSRGHIDRH